MTVSFRTIGSGADFESGDGNAGGDGDGRQKLEQKIEQKIKK